MIRKITALLLAILMVLPSCTFAAELTISSGGMYETDGAVVLENGPMPYKDGDLLYLPVVQTLQAVGFEVTQNGNTIKTPSVTLTAGSEEVYIGSTLYLSKRVPTVVNGVIYADEKLMTSVYSVVITETKEGTVKVRYGDVLTENGDEGLQTDDSWYYELVDQTDPNEGLTDVEIVMNNVRDSYLDATGNPTSLISRMRPDGAFTDIQYFNFEDTALGFPPQGHIDRIAALCAIAYCPENKYYKDPTVLDAIVRAADYWFKHKFKSVSFWYNVVGIPQSWQSVFVTKPDCLDKYMDDIKAYCKGADWGGNAGASKPFELGEEGNTENLTRPYTGSGPGPFERMGVSIKELFWKEMTPEEQKKVLDDCVEGMNIEISFVSTRIKYNDTGFEGETLSIQADGSYHDHANAFMTLAYGHHYLIAMMGVLCQNFKGTSYRLSDEAVRNLEFILLDSYQYAYYSGRGNADDVHYIQNNLGRGLVAADYAHNDYHVLEARKWYITELTDLLLTTYKDVITRPDELQDYANRMGNLHEDNLEGNRYFWVSDYLSHHRKNWNFSILNPSSRMKRQESLQGQNVNALFLASGPINLLTDGDDNAYPAARDWNRLPGTTVEMNYYTLAPSAAYPQIPGDSETIDVDPNSDLAGGTSDGMYGMSMCEFYGMPAHPTLKRAYFCFDDEVVCLASEIFGKGEDDIISTTLDQSLTKGAIKYGNATESHDLSNEGEAVKTDISGATWMLNGDKGFVLTGKEEGAYIETGLRSGNIVEHQTTAIGLEDTTKNITFLGIDHGKTIRDGSYECTILPVTTEEELVAYTKNPRAVVVANNGDVQAVWHKDLKILQAGFYKAGTVSTPDGELTVTVSQPCALMVRMYDDGSYSVHASDPQQRTVRTNVSISGEINKDLSFNFTEHEKGWYAGKTMHYYSVDGDFKDIATYDPNVKQDATQFDVAARLEAVMINGAVKENFNPSKHYYNIGTFDAIPEIRAKGNFETRVTSTETETLVRITEPGNPGNEARYTFVYKVREPQETQAE